MGWIRCVCWEKLQRDFVARTFCINCTSSVCFAPSFMQLRNDPKCIQILRNGRNISLGCNGVDWLHSLRKIPSWLRGTNFCMNWTSLVCFATTFMQLRNDPKCTQTLWKAPKHEFRVQWGGSGAFVGKNYNVTSWHELLDLLHQFSMFCTKFHAVTKQSQMHPNTTKHTETLL